MTQDQKNTPKQHLEENLRSGRERFFLSLDGISWGKLGLLGQNNLIPRAKDSVMGCPGSETNERQTFFPKTCFDMKNQCFLWGLMVVPSILREGIKLKQTFSLEKNGF